MEDADVSKVVSIQIPLGHALLAWETLSNKFSDLQANNLLSDEERRSIWGLADLLENILAQNGFDARPQAEWQALINQSKAFIKTIPVEFLD